LYQSKLSLQTARTALILLVISLSTASLACQINIGGPEAPGPAIQASSDMADSFKDLWTSSVQNVDESGEVMLIFNEEQLTSFLSQRLVDQENTLIKNPQVYLRDGMLQIYGTVIQFYMETSILISIVPVLSESGDLSFEIISADLGPFPLPEAMRTSISSILTEAFTGSIGSFATGIRIQSIAIADGELALVGKLR